MLQKKMTISEYIEDEYTPRSAPHPTTIARRIQKKIINGVKEGGVWYVLKDVSTGDSRADEILARHASA